MESSFRRSMDWLHTWAGVLFASLLFAIFWMGTLAVFDREIDRWMMPMTRLPVVDQTVSVDQLRPFLDIAAATKSPNWSVTFPTDRQPVLTVNWRKGEERVRHYVDPATGVLLPDPGSWAGTQFLYPFHYMLHVKLWDLGMWVVGLAAMGMLALAVSGIVIHRNLIADFFTFRAQANPRRSILDLHNITGVLGLPFHVLITLSGLIIFFANYFPTGWQAMYPTRDAFNADAFGTYSRPKLNHPGSLVSLDTMMRDAQRIWKGGMPTQLTVFHPGDAAAYVRILRFPEDRVMHHPDSVFFDGATGDLLQQNSAPRPVMTMQRFLSGLHFIQFQHWTLRWFYFVLGLSGCVLMATGLLFWLEARREPHASSAPASVRLVEGITIGSVTGLIIATLAFFVVNRLLPLGMTMLGYERTALEAWIFYLTWLGTFAHAWLRPPHAWIEQCRAIAGLALAAVLLNWLTTDDHLFASMASRTLWPVAGMDLLLLMGALTAWLTAQKLRSRTVPASPRHEPLSVAESQALG
ncbi:MAG: PepSY-associated TM helix domain-containing protein [Nitrospira sp.]